MIPYASLGGNPDYGGSGGQASVVFDGSGAFVANDSGGPVQSVYNNVFTGLNNGDDNTHLRQLIPASAPALTNGTLIALPGNGLANGGFTQVRAALMEGDNGFSVSHVSIGLWSGANWDCIGTPTELFFNGKPGFALVNINGTLLGAQRIMSDWANFTFGPRDTLVLMHDTLTGEGSQGGTVTSSNYTWALWSAPPKCFTAAVGAPDVFNAGANSCSSFFRVDVR